MKYIELEALDFKNKLANDEKGFFVDVRETYEFEEDNLGGNNIPMGEILSHINDLESHTSIYVCCKSGKRSRAVAYHLAKQLEDCQVYSCNGGLEALKSL